MGCCGTVVGDAAVGVGIGNGVGAAVGGGGVGVGIGVVAVLRMLVASDCSLFSPFSL